MVAAGRCGTPGLGCRCPHRSRPLPPSAVAEVAVDGRRCVYTEFGHPAEPVALLVPGLSDGLAPVWTLRPDRLARPPARLRGYRTVLASHRDPIERGVTTRTLASDVVGFLDALDIDHVAVLAGHSLGGMVAQHVAAAAPERIGRLALSATLAAPHPAFTARLSHWAALVEARRWRAFHRDALSASFTGAGLAVRRAWLELHPLDHHADVLAERHLALTDACLSHDATDVLDAIDVPTLVLAGERDPLATPDAARALAARLPDARLRVLPGVAHGFPEQRADALARELADFLGPVAQGAGS